MLPIIIALAFVPAAYSPTVVVGLPNIDCLPVSKQFPGLPQTKLYKPVLGKTWITKYPSAANPGTGLFILGTDRIMPNPDGAAFSPEGEMVEIDHWSGNRGYLKSGDRVETFWRGPAVLVRPKIEQDVTLENGEGTIHAGCIRNLTIRNWTVKPGWDVANGLLARAVSVQYCKEVSIQNVTIGTADDAGPGYGYGIQLQRSTNVNIQGVYATGIRHAVTIFAGGEIFVGGLFAKNPKGAQFDTHGFGAVNVYVWGVDCGGSDIAIGNKYPWGDQVQVGMAKNAKCFWVYGGSKATIFDSVLAGPLALCRNEYANPVSIEATRCTFTAFSTTKAVHYEGGTPETIVPKLTGCTLKEFAGSPGL